MTRVWAFGITCTLAASAALGQTPVQMAVQAYWDAHTHGRFEEAAGKREAARALVAGMAANAPEFGAALRSVAQLYQDAGMTARARSLLEEGLSRILRPSASQIVLLNAIAESWEQDLNPLRALDWSEKTAAALEKVPSPDAGGLVRPQMVWGFSGAPNRAFIYQKIANLHQRLGRPEAQAADLEKLESLFKNDLTALAGVYQQTGQTDEAIRTFKQAAAQAMAKPEVEPWEIASPFQALVMQYRGDQNYTEAAATLKQAIDAVGASSKPEASNLVNSLRKNLAEVLSQDGERDAADSVYRQLLAASNGPQLVVNYGNFLSSTGRGSEGQALLKNYLETHANLQLWEEINLLHSLENGARALGDGKAAEEYNRLAAEKQPPAPTSPVTISKDLDAATAAVSEGKIDEAAELAMKAIGAASEADDRDQVTWRIPGLAQEISRTSTEKAEQIYQRLLGLLESWSSDTVVLRLQVIEGYARFLMQTKSRHNEVPAAIERLKNAVVASHGADTGTMEHVLRLTIEFDRVRGISTREIPSVRDLLALEESLSGTTSEPYFNALETAAQTYESAGDAEHGLALRRQMVGIADVAFSREDARRGLIRMDLAFILARLGETGEAERMVNESAVIFESLPPPQSQPYAQRLQEIRKIIEQRNSPSNPPR